MDYAKESLRLHGEWKGKIEVVTRVPVENKDDLSLAYTPGVAQPCLEIQKNVDKSYDLTRRWNMCLVVTDGSAVLGLGNIGPEAGMPVMEGKCVLFKAFGDVDAFPLCIKSNDVDEIVNTIYLISGSFGGVNLEDISAPRCFEIEKKLKEKCDIPIFHDDQHGTAIGVSAGLTNALRLVGKKFSEAKVVINGAGSAGISICKLLLELGTGFAFLGNQYHLNVGGDDFYIDLLFYNLNLRCYVVIELKTGDFKPEYVGQLNFYLSAVDGILKKEQDNPSIGLLLCKSKNNVVAEYSLKDVSKPIGVSEYKITSNLPDDLEKQLPSVEDIQKRIK